MRKVPQYFANLERVLESQFLIESSVNSTDKGENREEMLVKVLNETLPSIAIAHRGGIILDCWDSISSQTDIVIYSAFAPLLRQHRKPLFLADGAFAAIEVKSVLNRDALLKALKWSKQIKSLEKGRMKGPVFGDTHEQICTGIFAYRSELDPTNINNVLTEFCKAGVPNTHMLDFICVNNRFCLLRQLNEFVSSVHQHGAGMKSKDITEQVKRETMYISTRVASFGWMISRISQYICYMRTTDLSFYLNGAIGTRNGITRSVGMHD